MSLLQAEFDNLDDEYQRQKDALRASAGLVAEAEVLVDAIKAAAPTLQSLCPLILRNYRDKAEVEILVWGQFSEFFGALSAIGISYVETETARLDDYGKSHRHLRLHGLDVPVHLCNEIMLASAA